MRAIELSPGQRFGLLVLLERLQGNGATTSWRCRCDCGTICIRRQERLRMPAVFAAAKSCGCYRRTPEYLQWLSERHTTHGHSTAARRTPTWVVWMSMTQRSSNPSHPAFDRYGGRGIEVCERWRVFANFLADMGARPPGMSIDRIDNDRGYEPGNCRWATSRQQAANRTSTRLSDAKANEIRGRHEHGERKASLARRFGVSLGAIQAVLRNITWIEAV